MSMQVAMVTRFGDPDVLVTDEAPDLAPGSGEALIEVVAADVLWVEGMIRRSGGGEYYIKPVLGQTFPLSQAADAHAAIEDRSVFAKTLLLTPLGVAA